MKNDYNHLKLINNEIFFSVENQLDIESFLHLEDQIAIMLAKHSENIKTSSTTQDTLFDKTQTIFYEKIAEYRRNPDYYSWSNTQLEWLSKLSSGVTLGKHLSLKENIGYPTTYKVKHMGGFSKLTPWANDFSFIFDWIENQRCFDDYGRVIFWINEPNQKTVYHRDYAIESDLERRDPFIWLTGKNKKRLLVKDPITREEFSSDSNACIFNTTNPHCSLGNEYYTSWSLRIDGVFNKEWARKAGIAEYFNLN